MVVMSLTVKLKCSIVRLFCRDKVFQFAKVIS